MAQAIPHDQPHVDPSVPRTVDDLLAYDMPTLAFLYRSAKAPAIEDLRGALVGRMLPSPAANEHVQGVMRALARLPFFPWKGKTFAPHDASGGEGWNRVFSDRLRLFRFTTSIGPSRAGGFDALHLNYDHPENPFFIRAIQDEVRTVAPGLWLGQAYVVVKNRPWLALYFALGRSDAAA